MTKAYTEKLDQRFLVNLPPSLAGRLRRYAETTRRPHSDAIRFLIEQALPPDEPGAHGDHPGRDTTKRVK